MEARSNKLQAKDLINVGIFTAIYFVIFFAGMMLGYIPIFIPLLGLVCPILCGIPFMLYLTKVKKFGMMSLTGIILGLLNVLIGAGVLVLIFGDVDIVPGQPQDLTHPQGAGEGQVHRYIELAVRTLVARATPKTPSPRPATNHTSRTMLMTVATSRYTSAETESPSPRRTPPRIL